MMGVYVLSGPVGGKLIARAGKFLRIYVAISQAMHLRVSSSLKQLAADLSAYASIYTLCVSMQNQKIRYHDVVR